MRQLPHPARVFRLISLISWRTVCLGERFSAVLRYGLGIDWSLARHRDRQSRNAADRITASDGESRGCPLATSGIPCSSRYRREDMTPHHARLRICRWGRCCFWDRSCSFGTFPQLTICTPRSRAHSTRSQQLRDRFGLTRPSLASRFHDAH